MKDPAKMSQRELRIEVVTSRQVIARLQDEKRFAYQQGWTACGNAVLKEIGHGK